MGQPADRRTLADLVSRAGYEDAFAGETSASVPCVVCGAEPPDAVELRLEDGAAFCRTCGLSMTAVEYLWRAVDAIRPPAPARDTSRAMAEDAPAELSDTPGAARLAPSNQSTATGASQAAESAPPRRIWGEIIIIALLAVACFVAGLMAAGLSGWANFQAFGAMADDPFQSRVWAWTGVIASICSFGGFTFVYWHFANGRPKEGLRAIVFAIAGAVTSVVGTEMFMANMDMARRADAEAISARRPVLEAQIEDWRTQLAGIPADIRTVEGLEAYLAEVERVGRTHQKPYRDAKVELGQAQRRAELETQISSARAELMGLGDGPGAVPDAPRREIPSWFFAAMLEVFASQGTSVGLVALLILLGGGRAKPRPAPP